ncbi:helix-turn-helix domain-containing protein [Granulicatella sp. zg-ZJ]|uniref:helix-turn-helix domain-containing protein n=1 Tax=unclassified Granulicatella TaxID=2630493 RepID=UPI0013C19494|nr:MULTISPECIES: helix-turn-helix transcriptional regulator [unclassified Granulicatella]MBS4750747.1 helix-turn-helix transcriptional regulator [Carnobacteriaceae bacterium zg-ZUI78]NEW62601.1 helix-turn-helix domain-containing protein [Granulicatella sp. zg-ZJ]NEW66706.1 helix-turn-helix domain-containing protein [Granulicatella sp. zg-84]QMI86001.1 helix-turn-helix transcriptional regulator [Carnobacteriaceae bacterium zg-84]
MNTLGEHIAKRVKELRQKAGMTQQELATKADIDWSTFNRIERGKNKNIQVNTLDKIIKALEIDYPEFFTFTGSKHIKNRIISKIMLLDDTNKILHIFEDILNWKNH